MMAVWQCPFCNFTYTDEEPNPGSEGGVVRFEEHPADWICPDCGAIKDDFEKIEDDEDDKK